MAHKLSGNASGLQGSEELSPRSQQSEVVPSAWTGAPDPPVVQTETVVSQSDVCPRGPELGSRRPVEAGVEARGMEISSRGGEVDIREVRPSGMDLFASRETTHCPLGFSLTHPAR